MGGQQNIKFERKKLRIIFRPTRTAMAHGELKHTMNSIT
jgi:hypothetical protein